MSSTVAGFGEAGHCPCVPVSSGNNGDLDHGATAGGFPELVVAGMEAERGGGRQHRTPRADRPVGCCRPVRADGTADQNRRTRAGRQRNSRDPLVPARASPFFDHVNVDSLAHIQRHLLSRYPQRSRAIPDVHHMPVQAHLGGVPAEADRLRPPPRPAARSGSGMRHATRSQQASRRRHERDDGVTPQPVHPHTP